MKGNRNPVGLRRRPLQIVDFAFGVVGQNGIFHWPLGHGAQVPNQGLAVFPRRANVAGGVRRPRSGIHAAQVTAQFSDRYRRNANVENNGAATAGISECATSEQRSLRATN